MRATALIERKSFNFWSCHKRPSHRANTEAVMTAYPFSAEARGVVDAPVEVVFAFLDDQQNLSSHMSNPSGMMLGTTMKITMEPDHTRNVGSRFGFTGSVLGIPLKVDEIVTSRTPPSGKTWETTEEPTLWVIGRYCMGFEFVALEAQTQLRVYIEYARPTGVLGAVLGWLFAPAYARWCTRIMVDDAVNHFAQTVSAFA
jgi:hypothetical protein